MTVRVLSDQGTTPEQHGVDMGVSRIKGVSPIIEIEYYLSTNAL